MIKVIMMKGLPGCGKSTLAKKMIDDSPNSYKRVNKDDLRAMLDNGNHSKDMEKFILQVRDEIIIKAIENGKHVIVDDTNLAPKHEERIKQLIQGKAELSIIDMTDVPIDVCIERDLRRNRSVGEKVIRQMHRQFIEKVNEYSEAEDLPRAIIVDIDGTLAKMNGRSPFDWSRVKEDSCNEAVKSVVNSYDGSVIVFSGRDGVCRDLTIEWLRESNIKFDQLFMREAGNNEKDSIIKKRLFDENIRGKFKIDFVLDDRLSVCRMWHQLGLQLLRVGDPDSDF